MADCRTRAQLDKKYRFWQVHVKAWAKSGLSQREYCGRRNISCSQFGYWKNKIKKNSSSAVNFVPVPVPASKPHGRGGEENNKSGLTIRLKKDIYIEVSSEFEGTTLLKLLTVLGGHS